MTAPRATPVTRSRRVQDGASDLDDMVSEQVGRHPKAMVALGVGIGFALGMLFATSRTREPSWRDYAQVGSLNAGGAAVGARVVRAFERPVRMQHHGAGVAHRVGIGVGQYLDIVTGG